MDWLILFFLLVILFLLMVNLDSLACVCVLALLISLNSRRHQRFEDLAKQQRLRNEQRAEQQRLEKEAREQEQQLQRGQLHGPQQDRQRRELQQRYQAQQMRRRPAYQQDLRLRLRQRAQPRNENVRQQESTPTSSSDATSYSKLCENCEKFFHLRPSGPSQKRYPHSETLSVLHQNAMRGCSMCAFVSRNLKTRPVSADEPVTFTIEPWSVGWHLFSPYLDIQVVPIPESKQNNTTTRADTVANFADTKHLTAWAQATRLPGEKNDSDMSISMARGWHSNCKATHVQCGLRRTSGSRTWQPTRLISFATSPENGEDIFRLVDGSTLPDDAEYVALSHCWGKVHLLRLLSSTEAGLRAGYPMTQLPKTFREAIQVCTWLEYRYIWIDSLCIIQDSPEDWQKEAQTMKLVYGQGAITLAAANASDSTKGMFTQRDVNGIIPPLVSCSWEDGRTLDYCVVDMHLRKDNVEQSNLATRAWTVQERVLSPRLLSFGQTQMFYQCLEGEFCESFPLGVPNFMVPTKTYHIHGTDADPRRAWSSIVETYSRAELTKDSDKFMAFSGIAEAMENRLGDRYLAGLWQDNLLIELLWSTMHAEKHRPTPCMAPTWSWLSTNSVILTRTQTKQQSVRRQLATITGTGVDLVDPSYPYGNIHPGAILQLRGRLKPAEWDQVDDYAAEDFRRYQVTCDGFHETRSSLLTPRTRPTSHLRIKVDERPGLDLTHLKISLLPIIVFAGREADSDRVEGIVLTPKDAAAGVYERVAHFSASQKLAAYLFLEKIPRSGSQNASERFGRELVKPNDVVDGFSFKGPGRWMKIEERDLLIV